MCKINTMQCELTSLTSSPSSVYKCLKAQSEGTRHCPSCHFLENNYETSDAFLNSKGTQTCWVQFPMLLALHLYSSNACESSPVDRDRSPSPSPEELLFDDFRWRMWIVNCICLRHPNYERNGSLQYCTLHTLLSPFIPHSIPSTPAASSAWRTSPSPWRSWPPPPPWARTIY